MHHSQDPLAEKWRDAAAILRRYGASAQADTLEILAAQLTEHRARSTAESVDLATAAAMSGYSRSHLRRLIRTGALRNHGTERAPALLISDLPRKPREDDGSNRSIDKSGYDIAYYRAQIGRAVVPED